MTLRITRQNLEALVAGDTSYARATRIYAQVLCSPTAVIEKSASNVIAITQEALYFTGEVSASNTISLTTTATNTWKPKEASNTINITQEAKQNLKKVVATNAIAIVQTAHSSIIPVEASNTISITQAAIYPLTYEVEATSAISITQAVDPGFVNFHPTALSVIQITQDVDYQVNLGPVTYYRSCFNSILPTSTAVDDPLGVKRKDASNTITITQEAKSHLHTPTASNTIAVTQEAIGKNYAVHVSASNSLTIQSEAIADNLATQSAISYLSGFEYVVDPDTGEVSVLETGLTNSAIAEVDSHTRSASSDIEITQLVEYLHTNAAGTVFETCAQSQLNITQEAERSWDAENTINIIGVATYELVAQPRSNLTMVTTATRELSLIREATTAISITHTVAYELITALDRCTYKPYIGSTTDPLAPTAPATTAPDVTRTDSVILIGGANTLTLRVPELGNRDRLDFTRINRESRGGQLTVYADPIWPKTENMQLDFIGLSESESQDILTFIENTLGLEIIVHDWESRSWYGFITNPDTPMSRDSRGKYSVGLELDIIADDAKIAGGWNSISITQTALAEVV